MSKTEKKYRKVGGGDFPPSYKFTKEGQWIECVYLETKEVESDSFESGSALFHTVNITNTSDGEKAGEVSILGSGLLNYLLKKEGIVKGQEIRITYEGMASYKDGKKTRKAKRFQLEVAE